MLSPSLFLCLKLQVALTLCSLFFFFFCHYRPPTPNLKLNMFSQRTLSSSPCFENWVLLVYCSWLGFHIHQCLVLLILNKERVCNTSLLKKQPNFRKIMLSFLPSVPPCCSFYASALTSHWILSTTWASLTRCWLILI